MLVHHKRLLPLCPPNTTYRYNVGYPYSSLVPIYPPKWREALWSKVSCSRTQHKPRGLGLHPDLLAWAQHATHKATVFHSITSHDSRKLLCKINLLKVKPRCKYGLVSLRSLKGPPFQRNKVSVNRAWTLKLLYINTVLQREKNTFGITYPLSEYSKICSWASFEAIAMWIGWG